MSTTKQIRQHVDHEDAKYFHVDWTKDKASKTHGSVVFPHSYVKCKSKHDLGDLLEYYGHSTAWWTLIEEKRQGIRRESAAGAALLLREVHHTYTRLAQRR